MPQSDLPEDHRGAEPHAVPVDVSKLTKILGYENVGYFSSEYLMLCTQYISIKGTKGLPQYFYSPLLFRCEFLKK